ncbi:MAG: hypothetical protein CVV16_03915 [Gammaproteobacteria bacterium HGW-Gammaproteobacteria-6]|nr:MAG: hypothetical protein CVV16_03915 [Gammaproteobacteria bacterium HGW-Gammaproteobacteria-6]
MSQTDIPSSNKRLLFTLLILALCIISISLIWLSAKRPGSLSSAPEAMTQERQDPRVQIDKMLELANQSKELARAAVQYNPSNSEAVFITEPFSSLRPQLQRHLEELDQITKAYSATAATDQERLLITTVSTDLQAFIEKGLNAVFVAAENDRFDDAIQLYYRQLEPAFTRYRNSVDALKRLHPEVAEQG